MTVKAQVQKIYHGMENTLSYLYGRWLDEHEFEDFGEYAKVMETTLKQLDDSVVFVKANKRPFGCIYRIGVLEVVLVINCKNYQCYSHGKVG